MYSDDLFQQDSSYERGSFVVSDDEVEYSSNPDLDESEEIVLKKVGATNLKSSRKKCNVFIRTSSCSESEDDIAPNTCPSPSLDMKLLQNNADLQTDDYGTTETEYQSCLSEQENVPVSSLSPTTDVLSTFQSFSICERLPSQHDSEGQDVDVSSAKSTANDCSLRSSESDSDSEQGSVISSEDDDDEDLFDSAACETPRTPLSNRLLLNNIQNNNNTPVPTKKSTPLSSTKLLKTPSQRLSFNDRRLRDILDSYSDRITRVPQRDSLTNELVTLFDEIVFDKRLKQEVKISWSKRMRSTAGFTKMSRRNGCRIELSAKVITETSRLRDTLIHEMCHAAVFVLDKTMKAKPHGGEWRRWTSTAERAFRESLPAISTRHSYSIEFKFHYRCIICHQEYLRHSKSIDLERKRCGKCTGKLELLPFEGSSVNRRPVTDVLKPRRPPNAFAQFVSLHYATVRKQHATFTPHGEIMKCLSLKYKEHKSLMKTGDGHSLRQSNSYEVNLESSQTKEDKSQSSARSFDISSGASVKEEPKSAAKENQSNPVGREDSFGADVKLEPQTNPVKEEPVDFTTEFSSLVI